MKLGAKIKQLREARKWTQQDLARKASLTRSHVSHIENSQITNPGAEAIVRLAKALEVHEDVLFEAAGIKPVNSAGDPLESAIHDPELRNWITVTNINSLTVDLQRAIAAIIRDFLERKQSSIVETANSVNVSKEEKVETAADPQSSPNSETTTELIENPIKARIYSSEEIGNFIKRLKNGALKVVNGGMLPLNFYSFWPEATPTAVEALKRLETFYQKNSKEKWDSDVLVNWMYSIPDNPVTVDKSDVTNQTIIRLDLFITRADKKKATISFWFDGTGQFELLKNIYQTRSLTVLSKPLFSNNFSPAIPPLKIDKVAVDELGKYLAKVAFLQQLNEPGLIAKYPPDPPKKVVSPEEMDSDEGPDKNIQAQANFVKA